MALVGGKIQIRTIYHLRIKNIENEKYIGYNASRQTKKCVHSDAAKVPEIRTSGLLHSGLNIFYLIVFSRFVFIFLNAIRPFVPSSVLI